MSLSSSEQPKLVTIIGGSGFIGTQLVQVLAKRGYRIRVGVRRPDLAGHVRPLGGVSQVQPVQVNVRYPESILAAVQGADAVVNLAGIEYETGRQRFRAVHSMGAKNVADATAAAGVETLVHMSGLGADIDSPSAQMRARAIGDNEVLAAFPKAVIVRSGPVFGQDDRFFNRLGFWARVLPVLPVVGDAQFQPIYVGDVAEALAAAVDGAVKGGKIYEIGGPETLDIKEIMSRVNTLANRTRPVVSVPAGLGTFVASLIQILPKPYVTADQIAIMQIDQVVSDEAGKQKRNLKAFGLLSTSMDDILPDYMWRFRKHGEFEKIEVEV